MTISPEVLLYFRAPLGVSRALFFEIAQIDERIQVFDLLADLVGDFDGSQLHQRRPANRLLHPQLTALHATCKINFTFAGQQRNGTHFAQIHAYRIVGVNRLFYRMRRCKLFPIMDFLGMKKIAFFIEGNPQRLVAFA